MFERQTEGEWLFSSSLFAETRRFKYGPLVVGLGFTSGVRLLFFFCLISVGCSEFKFEYQGYGENRVVYVYLN